MLCVLVLLLSNSLKKTLHSSPLFLATKCRQPYFLFDQSSTEYAGCRAVVTKCKAFFFFSSVMSVPKSNPPQGLSPVKGDKPENEYKCWNTLNTKHPSIHLFSIITYPAVRVAGEFITGPQHRVFSKTCSFTKSMFS